MVNKIADLIYNYKFDVYGIRAEETACYESGDFCRPDYPVGNNNLSGTRCIPIDRSDIEDAVCLADDLYFGKHLYLIGGNELAGYERETEKFMKKAVVLAEL